MRSGWTPCNGEGRSLTRRGRKRSDGELLVERERGGKGAEQEREVRVGTVASTREERKREEGRGGATTTFTTTSTIPTTTTTLLPLPSTFTIDVTVSFPERRESRRKGGREGRKPKCGAPRID
ncbi:hypothetical protein E2C01_046069 [Portunus trituberculatus]|uniref:Uncharacterized protein n=1 Tax=Portunus trituberculatus TaxID=210409 RepID=A0A5B7G391_PORTR|nr:hypothetical protein [Portunus trituberculatus]